MREDVKQWWTTDLRSGLIPQGRERLTTVYGYLTETVTDTPEHDNECGDCDCLTHRFVPSGKVAHCCLGVLSACSITHGLDLRYVGDDADTWEPEDEWDEEGHEIGHIIGMYGDERAYGVLPGKVVKWAELYANVRVTEKDADGRDLHGIYTIGIHPSDVYDNEEYTIAYREEGTNSIITLDELNDKSVPFAEIADLIDKYL